MKLAAKHNNQIETDLMSFIGGVNYSVPIDGLDIKEAQVLENWNMDAYTGMLTTSGGLREVYSFTSDIETMFIDNDGCFFFSNTSKLYKTDLSSLLNTYTLSGTKLPSYTRFDKKIVICSGGSIQYYDKQKTSKGLQTITDTTAPNADNAFIRNGRVVVYNSADDYLYHSGVGDVTNWIFASTSGIDNPTKIKLTPTTTGSLETAYHVDKLVLTATATASGNVTLTFDGDVAYTVTIADDDTAASIAQKIINANDYKGWTLTLDAATITFTATKRGKKDQLAYNYGSTGALGTVEQQEEGSGVYWYKVSAIKNIATADLDPVYAETDASETQKITLTANGGIKVSWSSIVDAVKYKVYGRTEEELTLLTTVTDTEWTDDGSSYNLGDEPPTVNNTAYTHIDSDATKIEIGYKDDGFINAIVELSSDVIIFKSNDKIFRMAGNYPDQSVYNVSDNAHCQNQYCVVQSGNNAYFYGRNGFKDLGTVVEYGSIKASNIGAKMDKVASSNSSARLWHLPSLGQIWIKADNSGKVYVYNSNYGSYSVRKFNSAINDVAVFQNVIYIAKGKKIYALNPYGDTEDDSNVISTYKSKRFVNKNKKVIKRIMVELYCLKDGVCSIEIGKYSETFSIVSNSPIIYQNTEEIYNNTACIWNEGLNVIDRRTNFTERDFDITVKITKGLAKIRSITLEVAEL